MIVRCMIVVVGVVGSLSMAPAARPQAAPRPGAQTPPSPSSPTEFFRKLLLMSAEEREAALAGRPEKARDVLRAGLREYDALPPEAREARLRTLDLKWYLLPLMKAAPTNRAAWLKMVPEKDRTLVEERLKRWDQLPAAVQGDVLACEPAVGIFIRPEGSTVAPTGNLTMITPQQRARIESAIAYLNQLPGEKRAQIYDSFRRILEVSDREQGKVLDKLSDAERKQMERSLAALDKLPAEERDQCIAGFDKFRALSPEERDQFLRSAERWQSMTPEDRRVWRTLVHRKVLPPPPSPPGLHPRSARQPETSPLVATNQ